MSRRVTVVLSQGRRLSAERQHREDELAARLLMSPDVEATIVGDLAHLDADSTDQLCLQSIPRTAILLAWHTAQQTTDELRRIGVDARLLNAPPHNRRESEPRPAQRREFYHYDLNDPQPPEFYLDVVARVAEEAEKSPVALTNLADGSELPLAASESARPAVAAASPRNGVVPQVDGSGGRDKLDDLMDALDRVEL